MYVCIYILYIYIYLNDDNNYIPTKKRTIY